MTESTLADAIIASSLASSRATSPAKSDLRPMLRTRSRSYSLMHPHRHHEQQADSSSPRAMKHTLRQNSGRSEDKGAETVKRGRHHFMRKHVHKHHEGDRKRWRDRVTERERKRYEGVWAANRGLYTFWGSPAVDFGEPAKPTPEADLVTNVIVRDIWERSRLPRDVLEEIWDLVARDEAKALQRDEFVVGMWLVDQRLKGRKNPTKVSPSVWASVRYASGVKISRKPL